jgi:hypothetical protein
MDASLRTVIAVARTMRRATGIVALVVSGCAPVALTPAGARVVVKPAPRAECALVASLRGSAGYNGRAGDTNATDVEVFLKNQAAERGADAMVITSRKTGAPIEGDTLSQPRGAGVTGGCPNCVTMTADAYRCAARAPAVVAAALGDPPFADKAAEAALAAAAESARACRKGDAPKGDARVKVTFATTGDVVYAEVEGEAYGGTPTGDCVARKFRNARVPPFAGEARSLSTTVRLLE